jgi:hypothetical protein
MRDRPGFLCGAPARQFSFEDLVGASRGDQQSPCVQRADMLPSTGQKIEREIRVWKRATIR